MTKTSTVKLAHDHVHFSQRLFFLLLPFSLSLVSGRGALWYVAFSTSGRRLYFCRPPLTLSRRTPADRTDTFSLKCNLNSGILLVFFLKAQNELSTGSPSLSMPTLRHLVKRHAWHAFLRLLVISHSFDAGQLYSMLPSGSNRTVWIHNANMNTKKLKETKTSSKFTLHLIIRLSNNCCIVFQKHIKKIKLSYLHQIKAGYIQVTLFTVNTLFFAFLHNPNIICKSENMHANVSQKKQVCRTICWHLEWFSWRKLCRLHMTPLHSDTRTPHPHIRGRAFWAACSGRTCSAPLRSRWSSPLLLRRPRLWNDNAGPACRVVASNAWHRLLVFRRLRSERNPRKPRRGWSDPRHRPLDY